MCSPSSLVQLAEFRLSGNQGVQPPPRLDDLVQGRVVGLQVALVAGDQETALTGFGVLHHAQQLGNRPKSIDRSPDGPLAINRRAKVQIRNRDVGQQKDDQADGHERRHAEQSRVGALGAFHSRSLAFVLRRRPASRGERLASAVSAAWQLGLLARPDASVAGMPSFFRARRTKPPAPPGDSAGRHA